MNSQDFPASPDSSATAPVDVGQPQTDKIGRQSRVFAAILADAARQPLRFLGEYEAGRGAE